MTTDIMLKSGDRIVIAPQPDTGIAHIRIFPANGGPAVRLQVTAEEAEGLALSLHAASRELVCSEAL